ncbi:MAG: pyruvate, phosphate dikinase [Bacteroidota bacterium]
MSAAPDRRSSNGAPPAVSASDTSAPVANLSGRLVYRFGAGEADGDLSLKPLLGGKGASLAEMSRIGLPVPPGFTISTVCCQYTIDHEGAWPDGLAEEVDAGLRHIEAILGAQFGEAEDATEVGGDGAPATAATNTEAPLLLSVRSGAAQSMPGMMDTVLNLGLNDAVTERLARTTGNERFAYDAYRRFIDMFGDVVTGVPHHHFEAALAALKAERGVTSDLDLTAADLRTLVARYKAVYETHAGAPFPTDPRVQLRLAINAVFASWNNDRAVKFRRINRMQDLVGTAVTVQAMVFGNTGPTSGTGVLFTRNPATGEAALFGEFLANAQGEDVVGGLRTPRAIAEMEEAFPGVYAQLVDAARRLEAHNADMQDVEFTVQDGHLFLLQTRNGKRTGPAALKIAVDFVREGLADPPTAVRSLVQPHHIDQLLHPQFADADRYAGRVIATGLPASPGAAVGRVVFTADEAERQRDAGERVLLVRVETSPEDVGGMDAAQGILTARGGMTSHAAVVARGWGTPCVSGCGALVVDEVAGRFTVGDTVVEAGDWLSINGSTGEVILGQEALVEPELTGDFETFMGWVDAARTLGVRANADTPADAAQARAFGAAGIGLCRTEHMFFGDDRIGAMREMILADTDAARAAALDRLLPFQRADFADIFRAMDGFPVTIRLLDPPLHEFVPHTPESQQETANRLGVPIEQVQAAVARLAEVNPMLGHRGCRLGITNPGITAMQARALFEAAVEVQAEGVDVQPEVMVPLVGTVAELADQRAVVERVAAEVFAERGAEVAYLVGTMIEIPRAALTAGAIAAEADFFSFGTNDLTQMTYGYSRDDAGTFIPAYLDRKVLPADPFQTLDREGVGQLVSMATTSGRATKPGLKVGLCGEHGGDPASVAFCHAVGLDYVSCSPFRIPIARLASAQAALAS